MNLYREIRSFYADFRGEKRIIGSSAEGRRLYAFFVGEHAYPVGICQYAMHAREWITALLALEHIARGVARGGVWFVPLVNPDGAAIVQNAYRKGRRAREKEFSLWKANAEGVDLNVNFPARWGSGKSNVFSPAPENYVGKFPLCAPESRALSRFTREIGPDYTVSWHTKGEEIYWRFHQPSEAEERDRRLAAILSASTGYPLVESPDSAGGYKDWCVESLGIPAFTVEVGRDALPHPLGTGELSGIVARCGNAVRDLSEGFI